MVKGLGQSRTNSWLFFSSLDQSGSISFKKGLKNMGMHWIWSKFLGRQLRSYMIYMWHILLCIASVRLCEKSLFYYFSLSEVLLLCCRVLLGKSCAMTLNQVSWSKFNVKDMYNVLKKCFLLLHFVKKNQESILCHDIYSVHIKMQICYMQPFFTCRIFCYLLNRPKYHI